MARSASPLNLCRCRYTYNVTRSTTLHVTSRVLHTLFMRSAQSASSYNYEIIHTAGFLASA